MYLLWRCGAHLKYFVCMLINSRHASHSRRTLWLEKMSLISECFLAFATMSLSRAAGSCCGWYLLSDHTLKAQDLTIHVFPLSYYYSIELVENESFFLEIIEKWIIFLSNLTFVLTIFFLLVYSYMQQWLNVAHPFLQDISCSICYFFHFPSCHQFPAET